MDKSAALVGSMRALQERLAQQEDELAEERRKVQNLEDELIKQKFRKDKKINALERERQSLEEQLTRHEEALDKRSGEVVEATGRAESQRKRLERERRELLRELEQQRGLIKRLSQQLEIFENKQSDFQGLVHTQLSEEGRQISQVKRLGRMTQQVSKEQESVYVQKSKTQKRLCRLYDSEVAFLSGYLKEQSQYLQRVACVLRSQASSFLLNTLRPDMLRMAQTDNQAQTHLHSLIEKQSKSHRLRKKYLSKTRDRSLSREKSVPKSCRRSLSRENNHLLDHGYQQFRSTGYRSSSRPKSRNHLEDTLVSIQSRIKQLTRLKRDLSTSLVS